ncbi:MAG: microcystin degradation protein MlrC [Solibacterales bacterium]|nr:microcystin degradation protein MlrC [Bryobacterales bacterium]
MKRIIVAQCHQEISSFNPILSHYEDFKVETGSAVIEQHTNARDELGGALSVFGQANNVEVVPTYSARSLTSGGVLAAPDFEQLSGEFINALRSAGSIDGIYFALHGAMCAEQEDDPEGYLLEESRKVFGDDVPLVISLDLHGVPTKRMLRYCDAVVVYHTYPHVDFFETGERAAKLLLSTLEGGRHPIMVRVPIPALVRGDELITETGSFGSVIRTAQEMEKQPQVLAAGMFIGNPFTDVPELRSNSLVVTDGDSAIALEQAIHLAEMFYEHHGKMQVPLTDVDKAVSMALDILGQGTVALVDAADATSSGASGDSNVVVRALIDKGYSGRVLAPIVDPTVVEKAFAAGVGATLQTTLGGSLDPKRFTPLEVEGCVRLLSDGKFSSETFGDSWCSGPTAILEVAKVTWVVTSRPVSLFDRALFYAHGQDPKRFDAVVVKSPHCESHMFADWCRQVINIDTPGATSANLRRLGHVKCARPVSPLDEDVPFSPQPEVYE